MDNRIRKSIKKLELQKQKKLDEKKKIEQELASIHTNLKQLHSFLNEQNKLQSAINDFYSDKKTNKHE